MQRAYLNVQTHESLQNLGQKFIPLKRRSTVTIGHQVASLQINSSKLSSLKSLKKQKLALRLQESFEEILKGINLKQELDRKQIPCKKTVNLCLECLNKITEHQDFLPEYFENFYNVFKKLVDYFDGIKNLLEIINTSNQK